MPRLFYHGFTLIEMLVVVVIIGVILSFATLAINNGGKPLEQEAKRLASLLTLASLEAVWQAQEIGIFWEPEGYRFYRLQDSHWQLLDEDLFRPHHLPPTIQLSLWVDSLPVPLEKCETRECLPQWIWFSSGEFTPSEVVFKSGQLSYRLSVTATGKVSLQHE